MSSLEIIDFVNEQSLENPVMEFLEERLGYGEGSDILEKIKWLNKKSLGSFEKSNIGIYEYDNELWDLGFGEADDLSSHILMQLIPYKLNKEEAAAALYIINNLNQNGYYTECPGKGAKRIGVSNLCFEKTLCVLRSLDPPGICAESLECCLKVQAQRAGYDEYTTQIIDKHLPNVAKNMLHVISKDLKISITKVRECCEEISTLNPRPAGLFQDEDKALYIMPDVSVSTDSDGLNVTVMKQSCPEVLISELYSSDSFVNYDEETKKFLREKYSQAEWLAWCIEQRKSTILSVSESIAEFQKEFFLYGKEKLIPLRLEDVANNLGIHESTVCRTVMNKYLQCKWGVFPLSYFFPKGFENSQNNNESTAMQIKEQIKYLISIEDKNKPFTDEQLGKILNEMGIDISRRTVAKYRSEMLINAVSGRKNHYQ